MLAALQLGIFLPIPYPIPGSAAVNGGEKGALSRTSFHRKIFLQQFG